MLKLETTLNDRLSLLRTIFVDGDYGMSEVELNYDWNDAEYTAASARVYCADRWIEDVMMEMVRSGNNIEVKDEDDHKAIINLDVLNSNFDKIPPGLVLDIFSGNYDSRTCATALQYLLYGEVIFA